MGMTFEFLRLIGLGLFYATPLLLFLSALIALLGQLVRHKESWSKGDALYYAFITATTVGYGDFHPKTNAGKLAAVLIALLGMVMTGIVVAIGVKAAGVAFHNIFGLDIPAN